MSKKQNIDIGGSLEYYLSLCKRAFFYNFLFSFFINVFMLSTSIYSLQILDRVLSSSSMATLLMLSIIMVVIYTILTFLQIIRSLIFTQVSNWLDSKLSSPLLENSISFESSTKGSQNLRDFATLKSFITGQTMSNLFDAPWAIIYFIVIFFIHWINGLIVVVGALILFILALINEKLTKRYVERANEINIDSMYSIESIAYNAEVVKAMGMKKDITNSWQSINKKLTKITNSAQIRNSTISNITKTIRLFIQITTMGVGAILVIKNQMSAGGIIAISILSGKALAPFDAAISVYKSIITTRKSYNRLNEALDGYQDNKEHISLPEPKGKINLEKLIYRLPNTDQFIIKGINININPGEAIGVIGPSGSGKTTLARLIVGVLSPTKGHVRIDDADVQNSDSEELGKYIGYLPQTVELFDASAKENISRMNKKADPQDIINAAKFVTAHQLISKLPEGYETELGLQGKNLSAGQRQRIGLARAFFGNPKLVVLDEPNSNLDSEGEVALIETIRNAKQNKITTVTISHRPAILSSVDKVLVLVGGEAKMFGPSKEIIDQFYSIMKNS